MVSQSHPKHPSRKKFCSCWTSRTTAEYISSNSDGRWTSGPGRADHRSRSTPPSTRRMIMSDSATLAPREDSHLAVGQDAAGDAAGEKAVGKYRHWVGDHGVSVAMPSSLVGTLLVRLVVYVMRHIEITRLDTERINRL